MNLIGQNKDVQEEASAGGGDAQGARGKYAMKKRQMFVMKIAGAREKKKKGRPHVRASLGK